MRAALLLSVHRLLMGDGSSQWVKHTTWMKGFGLSGLHEGTSVGGDNEEVGGDSCDHMLYDWHGLTSGAVGDVSNVQPPNIPQPS